MYRSKYQRDEKDEVPPTVHVESSNASTYRRVNFNVGLEWASNYLILLGVGGHMGWSQINRF